MWVTHLRLFQLPMSLHKLPKLFWKLVFMRNAQWLIKENDQILNISQCPFPFISPDFLRHAEYFQKLPCIAPWEFPTSRSELEEMACSPRISAQIICLLVLLFGNSLSYGTPCAVAASKSVLCLFMCTLHIISECLQNHGIRYPGEDEGKCVFIWKYSTYIQR